MEENFNIPQIEFKTGNIFNSPAKAMVLSASSSMDRPVGTGLDKAVYERAGKDNLIKERKEVLLDQKITELKHGSIFVTSAGDMIRTKTFEKIIHVIAPRYSKKYIEGETDNNLLYLGSIIEKIFFTARDNDIRSLSMPLIGSGALGFKQEDVKKIIVEAFKSVLEADRTFFNGFKLTIIETEDKNKKNFKDYQGIEELLNRIGNLIELPDFEKMDDICLKRWVENIDGTIRELKEHGTIAGNLKVSDIQKFILEGIKYRYHNNSTKKTNAKPKNLFVELLDKYEAQKNLTDAELLRRANRINDKPKLSKMRRDQSRLGRELIVRIAMALELSLEDAKDFIRLGSAGIEFPDSRDDWEMMVYESIKNKMYNVVMLDEVYDKSSDHPDAEQGMDIDITRNDRDIDR